LNHIAFLRNVIQEYPWGSRTAIAELLGTPAPSRRPQAELWMGAHPKAPSQVAWNGEWVSLLELIRQHPQTILGPSVAARFDNQLPYLFKVLAAARPLSIQAHPAKTQAQAGFESENRRRIPLDAPERNYRDPHHKPECICALTPLWALQGFRYIDALYGYLEPVAYSPLQTLLRDLRRRGAAAGLERFFETLLNLPADAKTGLIGAVCGHAAAQSHADPAWQWVVDLHRVYPGDIGVLSPLMLNLVRLEPGQALYLPPGELHAYLDGTGVELMANSDNVLRGGLTAKHVDVPELLKVLNFRPHAIRILTPAAVSATERVYPVPAEEFRLAVVSIEPDTPHLGLPEGGVEILLCTRGQGTITDAGSGRLLDITTGSAVLVPSAAAAYRIEGRLTLYKAGVPVGPPRRATGPSNAR
jgi:mannose-6-phosphate isomerase